MKQNYSIKIQVGASDELTALIFAFRLVQPMGRLLGREPKTAVIVTGSVLRWYGREISAALGENEERYQFHNCDEWSLETACDHIDVSARMGVNTVILSREYLEWDNAFDDNLAALEECLRKHEVALILIESAADQEAQLEWAFLCVPEWEKVSMDEILERILEYCRKTSTIAPLGVVPLFTLDPAVGIDGVLNPEIRVIVEYWRRGWLVKIKR